MTSLQVQRWNERDDGDLTEAAVRLRYLPVWHYRIAIHEYKRGPGGKFGATARAGDMFILAGECRVHWAHHASCSLERLDFVSFPAGNYTFEVLGSAPCRVAQVWLLPPDFRVPPKEAA